MAELLQRAARLQRCVRHVPARQLARRFWLNAKRKTMLNPLSAPFRIRRNEAPPVSDWKPVALFPARGHLVQEDCGQFFLTHLNSACSLQTPVDWTLSQQPVSTDLQRLAIHYHEFLESVPFELGRDIIVDWIDRAPPWQPRYWMDSWNCYGLSIRCVCWMRWLGQHRQDLDADIQRKIHGSIAEQVRFLAGNLETDICGNHLIKNITCLLWAGRYFCNRESRGWERLGRRLLVQQLPLQLLPDGMHYELSPAYHCQVFCDLLDCVAVLPELERSAWMSKLEHSAKVVADLTHPDGLISLFSDGGLHMTYTPNQCLAAWRALGGHEVCNKNIVELRSAGYFGLRMDRIFLLVDCGPTCAPALPAHGHADILSFELSVDGQRMIVDAGVGEYEPGKLREWGRSTAAHNTVTLGEQSQSEMIGSFRIGRRANGILQEYRSCENNWGLEGSHDGYSSHGNTITHSRRFEAARNSIRVCDRMAGQHNLPAISRLLLHHDCKISLQDRHTATIQLGETQATLISSAPIAVRAVNWSPDFGVLRPTHQVEMNMGKLPCEASFTLQLS